MTVNDFFRLVLKLFALYCLVNAIFSLLPSIGYMAAYGQGIDWMGILWSCFITVLILALFVLLAFQSDRVVAKLKLSQGFENPHIPFEKMDAHTIIKVGCILMGGIIFVENIPGLLSHLYIALRMKVDTNVVDVVMGYNSRDNTFELAMNILNLMLGYLLLTNHSWVAKWLARKEEEM